MQRVRWKYATINFLFHVDICWNGIGCFEMWSAVISEVRGGGSERGNTFWIIKFISFAQYLNTVFAFAFVIRSLEIGSTFSELIGLDHTLAERKTTLKIWNATFRLSQKKGKSSLNFECKLNISTKRISTWLQQYAGRPSWGTLAKNTAHFHLWLCISYLPPVQNLTTGSRQSKTDSRSKSLQGHPRPRVWIERACSAVGMTFSSCW